MPKSGSADSACDIPCDSLVGLRHGLKFCCKSNILYHTRW
jgi:hypothetical protein